MPCNLNISVIIATKNRSGYLGNRSLKSVINQTRKPDRIIIADDSDNQDFINKNIAVVKNFEINSVDLPIYHITNHRTGGASGTWNSAADFLLSQNISPENSYIAILDDDDEWHSEYLEKCSEIIKNDNSIDMVACDFFRITNNSKQLNPAPDNLCTADFFVGNPGIQGSNIFIRFSCFLEAGCFDENLRSCTDRDLCIRISDLGYIQYNRIPEPLMTHYAENNRVRLSTPGSGSKTSGLSQFWLKYSKRMSADQQDAFLKRAKKLFNWDLSAIISDKKFQDPCIAQKSRIKFESYTLYVGIICSRYKTIAPLLTQLSQLQKQHYIKSIRIFLLENNLPEEDENLICRYAEQKKLSVTFITSQKQDEWISKGFFGEFRRNSKGMFSIAQARTMLQKYVGQTMKKNKNAIAWILDEDMQITEKTLRGLKNLPIFKALGIDILIGKYEYSSPNPPINGIRTQLVDFWNNLCWLSSQNPRELLSDFSYENIAVIKKYPDYYYDLSRKHFGHLEHPFWIEPISAKETNRGALRRLCVNAHKIFGGFPLTRPLLTLQEHDLTASIKDSVNRGGNTFVFNPAALDSTPNLNVQIGGTDIRRSDMIWAVINKYYRKMVVKTADIPIWHANKKMKNYAELDIDKLREEILGSVLYAALTGFLATHPDHCLNFTEEELDLIWSCFREHLSQRMKLLRQTFYRARGISACLSNSEIYNNNKCLHRLTEIIESVFSKTNFELIEQNLQSVSFSALKNFLNSMQQQSDKLQNVELK